MYADKYEYVTNIKYGSVTSDNKKYNKFIIYEYYILTLNIFKI